MKDATCPGLFLNYKKEEKETCSHQRRGEVILELKFIRDLTAKSSLNTVYFYNGNFLDFLKRCINYLKMLIKMQVFQLGSKHLRFSSECSLGFRVKLN